MDTKPKRIHRRSAVYSYTHEEMKRIVLTCATCGGKFAPTPYTHRLAINNYCTRECQREYMKKHGKFLGGTGGNFSRD